MQTGTHVVERVYRLQDAVIVELSQDVKPSVAKQFIREQLRWLARIAEECDRPHTIVQHWGIKPRKVPASMAMSESSPLSEFSSIAPAIHVLSPLPASLDLIKALAVIAGNPEQQWFLHRVSPDFNRMTQIALSDACRPLIIGATPQQAQGRERSSYMTPSELTRMQKEFRQKLSVGSECEFDFELFSPVTKADYRRVWYRYSIVGELPGGDLLQLGLCQGVQPIVAPVR